MRPVLEFMARNYSPAWLLLADLEREVRAKGSLVREAEYVGRFLEEKPKPADAQAAWRRLVAIYRSNGNVVGGCSAFLRAAEDSNPPLNEISNMARWLNGDREVMERMDVDERSALFEPMARLMEKHIDRASATDLSRLAWLHLHAGNKRRALEFAKLGLRREPDHLYCDRLVRRLQSTRRVPRH
jgi:hypothetical protein